MAVQNTYTPTFNIKPNTYYAPGFATYGLQGVPGEKAKDGNSIFIVPYSIQYSSNGNNDRRNGIIASVREGRDLNKPSVYTDRPY